LYFENYLYFGILLFDNFNLLMKRFEKHIFVCENKRPPEDSRGCCLDKGSAGVRALFKKRLKELGLKPDVRANASGCLDACEFGVSVVVYPEQIWYGGVTVHDVEEIIQSHIINDKPVERLFIKHPKFQKDVIKI
jgi:(2Fe-2S) ferredoxin